MPISTTNYPVKRLTPSLPAMPAFTLHFLSPFHSLSPSFPPSLEANSTMEDRNSSSTRKRPNADPMSDSRQHRKKERNILRLLGRFRTHDHLLLNDTPQYKHLLTIYINSNECKKRKIKCSGHNICQRCENMGLRCIYAPPPSSSKSSSYGTS
jgi:Fungal Zn(2)-Cys(6) binuclear cluster domain